MLPDHILSVERNLSANSSDSSEFFRICQNSSAILRRPSTDSFAKLRQFFSNPSAPPPFSGLEKLETDFWLSIRWWDGASGAPDKGGGEIPGGF